MSEARLDTVIWRELSDLGERLLSQPILQQQHATILAAVQRLLQGEATLWLDEAYFQLPGLHFPEEYGSAPQSHLMQQALTALRPMRLCPGADGRYWLAVPLLYQEQILGSLQVVRRQPYNENDLELLTAIASVTALALTASHRFAVERWRIEQLQLVRKVALQVANVLDVDELADRVTTLIQETFGYYYVAVFTLDEERERLNFRSNAAKSGARPSPITSVPLGQGLIGLAARNGEEIVVPDVQADTRYRYLDGLPETHSEVVLPLQIEKRLVGVLDVQSDRLNAFHPNDLLVLRALADNVARAIDAARLYTNLRRRAEQLTVVSEVSKRLTSRLNLEHLMQDAADLLQKHFDYPYVHLFTVHLNRRQIIWRAGSGARSQALEGEYIIPLDAPRGIIPWVARHGETVRLNDVIQDERFLPSPLPPAETASELCVPLIFDGQVMGILDIQSDQPDIFDADDQLLAEAIGDTLAVAIRNADLYRSERWRRQVAESLREVAVLLSEDASLEQVLDAILTELERNLPSDASAIWLMDEEGEFYVAAAHGVDKRRLDHARRGAPHAAGWLLSAFLHDTPTVRQPDSPVGPLGAAAGFPQDYSSIAAPLKIGDDPLGLITLAHHLPGRYGHEARAMTTTFAGYAAVAIENARLYDDVQERAYASAVLLQVAQAVASVPVLDDVLEQAIRSLPILVGVERVVLFAWDAESERYRSLKSYGVPPQARPVLLEKDFAAGSFPLLDAARERRQVILCDLPAQVSPADWPQVQLPDADAETVLEKRAAQPLLMAFPVAIKNALFGVMLVEETDNPYRFRARRVEILTSVAQQLGMAMQNDRLQAEKVFRERLQAEMELARQIQKNFIPDTLPSVPGLDLAADWLTARQVGGDFYDVLPLPDGRLLIFIADVADKGMPAALFMALTRKLVHAVALDEDDPSRILTRVNALIYPDCRQGMFVTAVCGLYDPQTGVLTYANAGHNPPLLVRADGSLRKLTRTGMALGVLDDTPYTDVSIPLQEGDWLCFYTDGLTEIFSPAGEMFGEKGLLAALRAPSGPIAAEKVRQIVAAALDFTTSGEVQDDLTLLLVRKKA